MKERVGRLNSGHYKRIVILEKSLVQTFCILLYGFLKTHASCWTFVINLQIVDMNVDMDKRIAAPL
ncbi:hypothetical protein BRW62_05745 [Parathermosynechococcus lividus PCC 6715]|uniref:Uncharacterized protein n=1 Tax=Parathermosynechococcus lividus PCC 6715 TaxID=1917166 RepID=A0A2D2Q1L5_PARLV|nr:hypothetical protein BRW62_05745 [Thermostichus lividus PCC 6715]